MNWNQSVYCRKLNGQSLINLIIIYQEQAGGEAGLAISTRGQAARARQLDRWTQPKFNPREHKDKSHICSGGVEGFTGPEEKGEGDGIGIGIKNRGE